MGHAIQLQEQHGRIAIMVLYEGHPTFKFAGWLSPIYDDGKPTDWTAYWGRSTRIVRRTKEAAAAAFLYEHVF